MSRQVDERVVSMKFNYASFKKNAESTMSVIDKLKEKLNFKGVEKAFDGVEAASKKVTLSGLTDAAEKVEFKFSAMGVAGITAIQKITSSAIDAGARIAKSLSIDQLTAGFSKYTQKTQSVQTIMNATGLSIDEVSDALDRLNWFTDETSYNFSDMVNNIAKFTNNDVPLEQSISSVMGIALAAADAGANANEASRAMYNFSQAISTGAVKLIDWKSIENANMATATFKETIIESAVALGTLKKTQNGYKTALKGTTVSVTDFNSALSEGWFTSEVLLDSLGKYSAYADKVYEVSDAFDTCAKAMEATSEAGMELGARAFKAGQQAKTFGEAIEATKDAVSSGWMKTYEIIFGNYEESVKLWTDFTNVLWDVFASGAEKRNDVLKEWKSYGGRDAALDAIANSWKVLLSVIEPVKQAFKEMFPPITGERLAYYTYVLNAFIKGLKLSEESGNTLKVVFKALLSPLKALSIAFRVVGAVALGVVYNLARFVNFVLSIPSKLKSPSESIRKFLGDERYERLAKNLTEIANRILGAFKSLGDSIKNFWNGIKTSERGNAFLSYWSKLLDLLSPLVNWVLDKLLDGIEAVLSLDYTTVKDFAANTLTWIYENILKIGDAAGKMISPVKNFFKTLFGASFGDTLTNVFSSITNPFEQLKKLKTSLNITKQLENLKNNTLNGLTKVINAVGDAFAFLADKMDFTKLSMIAFNGASAALVLSLARVVNAAGSLVTTFGATIGSFGKIMNSFADRIKPNKYQQMATAIAILAGALTVMAMVKPENLKQATYAMLELMGGMVLMISAISLISKFLASNKDIEVQMLKLAGSIAALSGSLLLVSLSLLALNNVNMQNVLGKLAIITAMFAGLSLVTKVMGTNKYALNSLALELISFSAGIYILVKAFMLLDTSLKDIEEIKKNLLVLGGLMVGLSAAAKLMSKVKIGSSLGLLAFTANIFLLIKAMKKIEELDYQAVLKSWKNFLIIGTVIYGISKALSIAGNNAMGAALAIGTFVLALNIMRTQFKKFEKISFSTIVKSLIALTPIILSFGVVMLAMKDISKNAAKAGQSILYMSVSLIAISGAISLIGNMNTKAVTKGTLVVLSLMGLYAVILKASESAQKATAPLIAISASLVLMAGVMKYLSNIPLESILVSTISLSAIFLSMSKVLKSLKQLNFKTAISYSILMGVLFASVSASLYVLSSIPTKDAAASSAFLLAVLLGVTTIVDMLEKIDFKTAMSQAVLVGLLLAETTAALYILSNVKEPETLLKVAGSILLVLGGITAIAWAVSKLAYIPVLSSVKAIGIVALIGVLFTALGAAFYEISKALGSMSDIDRVALDVGMDLLLEIGTGIGKFFGNIIGGFITGAVIEPLYSAVDAISNFVDMLGPFVDKMSNIDDDTINKIDILATLVSAFGSKYLISGLKYLASNSGVMDKAGTELEDLGSHLKAFVENANGIPEETPYEKVTLALQAINGFLKYIPRSDGVLQWFIGEVDLAKFGEGLAAFGVKLIEFSENTAGLDERVVEKASAAAKTVTAWANTVPPQGGLLQKIIGGEIDLAIFGSELASFGYSLSEYVKTAGWITEAHLSPSSAAINTIIDFANKAVPNASLSAFGEQLSYFGNHFAKYSEDVSTVNIDGALLVSKALGVMAKDLKDFPNTTRLNFKTLGSQLKTFGSGFKSFSKSVSGVTQTDVNNSSTVANAIVPFLSVVGQIPKNIYLKALGDNLEKFGASFSTYASDVANLDYSVVTKSNFVSEAVKYLASAIDALNASGVQNRGLGSFGNQLSIFGPSFISFFKNIREVADSAVDDSLKVLEAVETLAKAIEQIDDLGGLDKFVNVFDYFRFDADSPKSIGEQFIQGFLDAFTATDLKSKKELYDFEERVVNTLKGAFDFSEFEDSGKYIVEGIAEGVEKNEDIGSKAVRALAKNLVYAFNKEAKIESPSKVFRDESGVYIVQGIAEGISSDTSAEEAIKQKVQNIVSAFKTELDKISLDVTTLDLESKLWQKLNPYASTSEVTEYNIKLISEKLELQSKAVELASAEYKATLQKFGEESEYTQEAYNKLLQEKISLTELAESLSEAQTAQKTSDKSPFLAYSEWLKNYEQDLLNVGFAKEEIEKMAREETGFDPNAIKPVSALSIYSQYMSGIEDVSVKFYESTKKAISNAADNTVKNAAENVSDNGYNLFSDAAENSLAGFKNGIISGADKYIDPALRFFGIKAENGVSDATESHSPSRLTFRYGEWYVEGFANGALNKAPHLYSVLNNIFSKIPSGSLVQNGSKSLKSVGYIMGKACATGVGSGMTANMDAVSNSLSEFQSAYTSGIATKEKDFVSIGSNVGKGIIEGIGNTVSGAINIGKTLANALYNSTAKTLDINSPSRKFESLGEYSGIGFINGIKAMFGKAADTTEYLGEAALDGLNFVAQNLSDYFEENLDYEPVIRPLVDLTNVKNREKEMRSLFDSDPVHFSIDKVHRIANRLIENEDTRVDKEKPGDTTTNYQFVQNNYSPKALSRQTIYRQTRNQFAMLKEKGERKK